MPAGAGDSSGALLAAGAGGTVSVPVTLRGMVAATASGDGTSSSPLTGGDGRAPGDGQVAAYEFTVPVRWPHALRSVTAGVVLANDPANQVSGCPIAPDGQTTGYVSNYLTTGFTPGGIPSRRRDGSRTRTRSDDLDMIRYLVRQFGYPERGAPG